MVMPPRNPTVLDAVQSVLSTIRKQEQQSLQVLDKSALSIEEWLKNVIEERQQQVVATKKEERKEPAKKKPKVDEQDEEMEKLPKEVVAFVMAQKVPELRGLLRERGLDPYGLKKVLQQRLLTAMESECSKSDAESMEQEEEKAADPPGSSPTNDMDELEFREDEEEMKARQPEPIENPLPGPSRMDTAQPTLQQPIELTVVEPMSKDDDIVDEMEVDEIHSASDEIEAMVFRQQEANVEKSIDISTSINNSNFYNSKATKASKSPTVPASPAPAAQSPLQQIASGVKSALKKLSPLKQKSAVAGMIEKIESSSKHKNHEDILQSKSSESGSHTSSLSNERVVDGAVRVPLSASSFAKQTKKPVPVVSKNLKAAQEARRERLAELRNKSKPLIFTSTATMSSVPAMPKVKPMVGSSSNYGKETSKRNILAQQMRQKAALKQADSSTKKLYQSSNVLKENSPNKAPKALAPQSSSKEIRSMSAGPSNEVAATPGSSSAKKVLETPASTTKPAANDLLSPLDTYELSDREQSDSDSEDDENYGKPKKRIPEWAQKSNLVPALEDQFIHNLHDPDQIFGEVQTCDLQAIFDQKKTRYKKRTSTGNWTQDRATAAEKLAYKRAQGYGDDA